MGVSLQGRPLVAGEAEGTLFRLGAPLSFWGGVDPYTGLITQPKHPDHRASIADVILAIPRVVGSSSSSSVLLELIYEGRAPKAILLGEPEAILALGALVGREMDFGSLPIVVVPLDGLASGMRVKVTQDGRVEEVG
jgi:predicted aconitase with swiveling domain